MLKTRKASPNIQDFSKHQIAQMKFFLEENPSKTPVKSWIRQSSPSAKI